MLFAADPHHSFSAPSAETSAKLRQPTSDAPTVEYASISAIRKSDSNSK